MPGGFTYEPAGRVCVPTLPGVDVWIERMLLLLALAVKVIVARRRKFAFVFGARRHYAGFAAVEECL